ncbi:peptide chain release factor N(5)-glutamine methyltransferase [candidate division KSB1 bacterium]|nr:peptide chain release factor N(5)-glutamine methyltransferase [candidate division KSB1 bacterium]
MSDVSRRLIDLLNLARGYLQEKGVDNPRGDAESLLGKALGLPRIQLYLQHDRPLSEAEVAAFRDLLRRRGKREPLQLILGEVEFCGVRLEVLPGLLIPRPETEQLANMVGDQIRRSAGGETVRVLDIGCGTGCIAVALARGDARVAVDAVDIDYEALRCTTRNAARNDAAERVHVRHADVMNPRFAELVVPPYDWVVSNPPYIPVADFETLQPEVKLHESARALVAGATGVEFYHRIAELLPLLLRAGGRFAMEIGFGQAERVAEIFRPAAGQFTIERDLAGIPRMLSGQVIGGAP